MKKKYKLKDNMEAVLIISIFYLTVVIFSALLANRLNNLQQQKMTDTQQSYISQRNN